MPTRSAAVYIGRFQPFHDGHREILNNALNHYDDVVVVLGSSHSPRTLKNPWSPAEREEMIRRSFSDVFESRKLRFHWQHDVKGADSIWAEMVVTGVQRQLDDFRGKRDISLVGSFKDESSYYLRLFPGWGLDLKKDPVSLSGTCIREMFFKDPHGLSWVLNVPSATFGILSDFKKSDDFRKLVEV